jgi:hypothetical protein
VTPAWLNRRFAPAGSWGLQAWAASEESGLALLIGPPAGVYWPRKTTRLSVSRSRLISNALRTWGSRAIGPANRHVADTPSLGWV